MQVKEKEKPGKCVILGHYLQPDTAKKQWSVNYASESVLIGSKGARHANHSLAESQRIGQSRECSQDSERKAAAQPKYLGPREMES